MGSKEKSYAINARFASRLSYPYRYIHHHKEGRDGKYGGKPMLRTDTAFDGKPQTF